MVAPHSSPLEIRITLASTQTKERRMDATDEEPFAMNYFCQNSFLAKLLLKSGRKYVRKIGVTSALDLLHLATPYPCPDR